MEEAALPLVVLHIMNIQQDSLASPIFFRQEAERDVYKDTRKSSIKFQTQKVGNSKL